MHHFFSDFGELKHTFQQPLFGFLKSSLPTRKDIVANNRSLILLHHVVYSRTK